MVDWRQEGPDNARLQYWVPMDGSNPLNSRAVVLACLGLSEDGQADLSASERRKILGIATDLHRRAGWETPPDVLRLAAIEGIRVFERMPLSVDAFSADEAWIGAGGNSDDRTLLLAHAVAGALLLRRGADPRGAWALAAELLVPSWADPLELLDRGVAAWLVNLRSRTPATPPGSRRGMPATG